MFFLCFVFLSLLPYQGFGQQCRNCQEGFTYSPETNKCYKVVGTKQTWDEAFTACNKLGSHLVIPESASELGVLANLIKAVENSCIHDIMKKPGFWCAARRICPNKEFAFQPNTGLLMKLSYATWIPGEPNNQGGNEDCIHILAKNNAFVYNDIPCGSPNCYICEVDQQ